MAPSISIGLGLRVRRAGFTGLLARYPSSLGLSLQPIYPSDYSATDALGATSVTNGESGKYIAAARRSTDNEIKSCLTPKGYRGFANTSYNLLTTDFTASASGFDALSASTLNININGIAGRDGCARINCANGFNWARAE